MAVVMTPTNALCSQRRDGCFTCGTHTRWQRKRIVTVKAAHWDLNDVLTSIGVLKKKQDDEIKPAFMGETAVQQSDPSIPLPPTFKCLSRDIVVLLDPQHNRLVYLVGVDVADSSAERVAVQLRTLQNASGAQYLHLLDLPDQLRRVILRKFPGGHPVISQVPLPPHLASAADSSSDGDSTTAVVRQESQEQRRGGVLGMLYGDRNPNEAEDDDGASTAAAAWYGSDDESYDDGEMPDRPDDVRSRGKKVGRYMSWLKGTSSRVALRRDSRTPYKLQPLLEDMNEFGPFTAFMPSSDLLYTRNYMHDQLKDDFEYVNYLDREEIMQEYKELTELITQLQAHEEGEEKGEGGGGSARQQRKWRKGKGSPRVDGGGEKEGPLLLGRATGGVDDDDDETGDHGQQQEQEEEEQGVQQGGRVADVFQRLLVAKVREGRRSLDSDNDLDGDEDDNEEEGVGMVTLDENDAEDITELLQSLGVIARAQGGDTEEEEAEEEAEEGGESDDIDELVAALLQEDSDDDDDDDDDIRYVQVATENVADIVSQLRQWRERAREQAEEGDAAATSIAATGAESSSTLSSGNSKTVGDSSSSNTASSGNTSSDSGGPELLADDFFLRREPAVPILHLPHISIAGGGGSEASSRSLEQNALSPLAPRGVWMRVADGPIGWTVSIRTRHWGDEQQATGGGSSSGDSGVRIIGGSSSSSGDASAGGVEGSSSRRGYINGGGGDGSSEGDSTSAGVAELFDAFDKFLTEINPSTEPPSSKSTVEKLEAAWRLQSPQETYSGLPSVRPRDPDSDSFAVSNQLAQLHQSIDDDDDSKPQTAECTTSSLVTSLYDNRVTTGNGAEAGALSAAAAAAESDNVTEIRTAAVRLGADNSSLLDSLEDDWRQVESGRTATGFPDSAAARTTTGATAAAWGVPSDRLLRPTRPPTPTSAPTPTPSDPSASLLTHSAAVDEQLSTEVDESDVTSRQDPAHGPVAPSLASASSSAAAAPSVSSSSPCSAGGDVRDVDSSDLVSSTRLRRGANAAIITLRNSSISGSGATHALMDVPDGCPRMDVSGTPTGYDIGTEPNTADGGQQGGGLTARNGGGADGIGTSGSTDTPMQGPSPPARRGRARMVRRPRRLMNHRSAAAAAEGISPGEGPTVAAAGGGGSGGDGSSATSAASHADGSALPSPPHSSSSAAAAASEGANSVGAEGAGPANGALDVPIPAYKQHRRPSLLGNHPAEGVTAAAAGLGSLKESSSPHSSAGVGKGTLGRPGGSPPSTSVSSLQTGAGAVRSDGVWPTATPEAPARQLADSSDWSTTQQRKTPGAAEPQPQPPTETVRAAAAASASEISRRMPPPGPGPSKATPPPASTSSSRPSSSPPDVFLSQTGDAVHPLTPPPRRQQAPRLRWQRHGAPLPLPRDLSPRYTTGYGRIAQRRYRKLRLPFGLTRLLLPTQVRMSPPPAVLQALKSLIERGGLRELETRSNTRNHTTKVRDEEDDGKEEVEQMEQGKEEEFASKKGPNKKVGHELPGGLEPRRRASGIRPSSNSTGAAVYGGTWSVSGVGTTQPAGQPAPRPDGGFLGTVTRFASTVLSRLRQTKDMAAPPPAASASSASSYSVTGTDEVDMALQALENAPLLVRQRAEALVSYLRGRRALPPPSGLSAADSGVSDKAPSSCDTGGLWRSRTGLPGLVHGKDAVVLVPLEVLQPAVGVWQVGEERLMHPDVRRARR